MTLACRIRGEDRWWWQCRCRREEGEIVPGRLAHEIFGWCSIVLQLSVHHNRCLECVFAWSQYVSQAALQCAKLSRTGVCCVCR